MLKQVFKTCVALLAIASMAIGPVRGQNANPDVTLDFTTNTWDFPAGKANITYAANSYTSGDYTITLQGGGSSSNGYYFNSDYLLLGKSGAYLQLPAFESAVDSIVVVGHSGASANVNQNIYVGETAVSTQTTGATGPNTYVIDEDYRAAGNIYTLKVESAHNTQISYIKVYYASSGGGSTPEPEPEPAVPHSVRMAAGTEETANWTLASGNASVPGTQVLEGVMSGSQLTATYAGIRKVKRVKAVKWINPNTIPLTVEALTDGTIRVTAPKSGMKYSKNGGEKIALTTTITIDVVAGDKVAFYGSATSYNGTRISGGNADVKVYGNIMSLIDEENFATATTLTEANTFRSLFSSYSRLTDASGLLLPATTLASGCYYQMFSSCYGLTAGPELLPATELANVCYQQMFSNCTTLVAAPALPATTLAENCYRSMFYSCKSLTTAPALPATTLAPYCYQQMFGSCSKLTTAPELPATTLAPYCYQQMFSNCTTLVAAPALPATELANYCYAYMFYSCSNLTTAPALPATELANDCYQSMFSSCYSLAAAPELPATTMAPECYTTMFYNCTTLTAVPVLPATTLATYCYNCMFQGCTGLTTVPSELLPATTLAPNCYYGMFQSCTNLTTGPELPATTLTDYCYGDMFRNCSNLANVTCLATSGAGGSSTNRWLLDAGTQATGTKTFTAATAATWPEGVNGIPDGWTRLNPDGSEWVEQ